MSYPRITMTIIIMTIITASTDRFFRDKLDVPGLRRRPTIISDCRSANEFLELERPACFEIGPMAPAVRQAPA
jgi:hypothetical protein